VKAIKNLPSVLKEQGLFCLWKYEANANNEHVKMPINPSSLAHARANDISTFARYSKALEALNKSESHFEGIGLGIFAPIAGIDIDNCASDQSEGKISLSEAASDIIDKFSTYTELSPSGTGVHLYFQVPPDYRYDKSKYYIKSPSAGIEIYCPGMTSRYLTVTGNAINNYEIAVGATQVIDAMNYTLEKYMPMLRTVRNFLLSGAAIF
jgi:putative DNA primase/helicase